MVDVEARRKEVLEAFKLSPYIDYLEIEMLELEETTAIARMPYKEKFYNTYGFMHGGCLYSFADTVAGILAAMCGDMCTTSDGGMTFMNPAKDTKYIYAKARMVKVGSTIVSVRVELTDDKDKLLDDAYFNYCRINHEKLMKKLENRR